VGAAKIKSVCWHCLFFIFFQSLSIENENLYFFCRLLYYVCFYSFGIFLWLKNFLQYIVKNYTKAFSIRILRRFFRCSLTIQFLLGFLRILQDNTMGYWFWIDFCAGYIGFFNMKGTPIFRFFHCGNVILILQISSKSREFIQKRILKTTSEIS
jgi:hypothetical protein